MYKICLRGWHLVMREKMKNDGAYYLQLSGSSIVSPG